MCINQRKHKVLVALKPTQWKYKNQLNKSRLTNRVSDSHKFISISVCVYFVFLFFISLSLSYSLLFYDMNCLRSFVFWNFFSISIRGSLRDASMRTIKRLAKMLRHTGIHNSAVKMYFFLYGIELNLFNRWIVRGEKKRREKWRYKSRRLASTEHHTDSQTLSSKMLTPAERSEKKN